MGIEEKQIPARRCFKSKLVVLKTTPFTGVELWNMPKKFKKKIKKRRR